MDSGIFEQISEIEINSCNNKFKIIENILASFKDIKDIKIKINPKIIIAAKICETNKLEIKNEILIVPKFLSIIGKIIIWAETETNIIDFIKFKILLFPLFIKNFIK